MSVNSSSIEWRFRTSGGIPYKVQSRSGSFSQNEASATEIYIIRSANLLAFALESFPLPLDLGGSLFFDPRRTMPGTSMLTKSVKWKSLVGGRPIDPFGIDDDPPDNTYEDNLEVTVEYSIDKGEDGNDDKNPDDPQTFLEISANATGQFLALPIRGNAKWVVGDNEEEVREVNIPGTLVEPETEWTVRWPQVPSTFFTAKLMSRIRSKLGKVNSSQMSLLYDAPAETVLFTGFSSQEQRTWQQSMGRSSISRPPLSLEFKFTERNFKDENDEQITHNHVYRPGKGYQRMTIDGNPLYAETNLSDLFRK